MAMTGQKMLGVLSSPWAQSAIAAAARGAGESFNQWAKTVEQYAPLWTRGAVQARAFQGGFQTVGVAQGASWYGQLYTNASLSGYSDDQIRAASLIHGIGQGLKLLGTGTGAYLGMQAGLLTGIGPTWGAGIGAVAVGTITSTAVDWLEQQALEFTGIQWPPPINWPPGQ